MNETVDVVVVGGGGAGLAAAIEAREAGARVLLLEKNPKLGGSTAWSIGSVSATQTPHQRAKGIVDTPQHHWEDMPGFAGELAPRDNDALRKILCDEVPAAFQWLLDSGVRFMGPMPEPPHRQPRMHNVLPNSRSFIYHLERRARRAGVVIRCNAQVRDLVVENGRVTAVRIDLDGQPHTVGATKGIILAAGDFTNSPELKARFMGPREAKVEAINMTATGDGQRMAEALGAVVLNGDLALGPELRFIPPARETLVRRLPPWRALAVFMQWSMEHMPQALLRPFLMQFLTTALAPSLALFEAGAVLVNQHGKAVTAAPGQLAYALADEPGNRGWIVFGREIAERFSAWPDFISTAPGVAYAYLPDYARNRKDIHARADSPRSLADKLGMDSTLLEQAMANQTASGPFVALGPVRSVFVHSEGGLKVDLSHRVLDSGGQPIPGLYAVGSTGQGGLLLKGHGHHLAWAFVSGRRAGKQVAAL
ncbi:FAD-dependent oxidoreductase [Bordetella sp. BOR01]|uniref:FAD-dependent oxidoreductase n=1 Tax=Bordetella sp. BOR01 TaxID=2854779 RepID=UPI001C465DBA|nr:FAD-dependent oxidoreductase [Bordetella sp. BOR01]MBV7484774.1 FAD-dependent oxidoreductase [Bordetella sp. BOR01]